MNKFIRLEQCCEIELSSVDKKSKTSEKQVKLCNFTDVYYNWNIYDSMIDDFMTATASDKNIEIFSLKQGDVLITKDSETRDDIGMTAYVYDDMPNVVLGYHCALIRPNDTLDGAYLNAYFNSRMGRKYFENQASGSGQRYTLTKDSIGAIKIPFIDKDKQIKIGKVFSTIDEKIKNNKLINIELESLAKTIYDYWFLQFEFPNEEGKPYKSSGGKMVWNEELKREIPERWEAKQLKDLLKLGDDKKYNGPMVNTIDLSVMPSSSISLSQLNTSDNFDTNLFEMKKGDILFGSIRPYLKKAGIAPYDGAVTGTVHRFRPIKDEYYNFALLTLCNENMFKYAVNSSQGTKMPVVTSNSLLNYPVAYSETIIAKFNSIINIKDLICHNVMENQQLSSLRDWLLPMLLNGQVTFKEKEEE